LTRLRLIAASFVLLSSALLPALFASPSQAADTTYTLSDYNARVTAAQTAVSDAQAAVDAAQTDYDNSSIPVVTSSGSGLKVDVYNSILRNMVPNPATLCRSDTFAQIAANWGNGSVAGCNSDRVTIHYYGTITVPDSGPYYFRNIADDGFYLTINGQVVINEWRDKGCGGNWGTPIQLTAGTAYTLDGWFYENGGGACSTLYVMQPSGNWQVVPASWFGTTAVTTYTKDPALLDVLNQKKADLQAAQDALAAIPTIVINPPTNLASRVNPDGSVLLIWDAPTSDLIPERYAIFFSNGTSNGWAVSSTVTSIVLPPELFANTGGWNSKYTFKVRSDNDTAKAYSDFSNDQTLYLSDPTPPPVVVIPPALVETPTATVDTPTVVETPTVSPSVSPTPEPTPPSTQETTTVQTPETSPSPSDTSTVDSQTVVPSDPTPAPEPQPVPPVAPVEPSVPPAPAPEPEPLPEPQPAPEPAPDPAPEPAPDPAPAPDPQPEPAPDPAPAPEPDPAPEPSPAPAPEPAPIPEPKPDPAPETPVVDGLIPNNPNSLPDDIPKEAPAELLVPHIQEDKAGVENGGIEFFGTKTQPQVIGEDGKLTPPPPPPGSGLPIPPDAITTTDTFIGQPGGTTFNAPDIAVPVIETPVTGALAVVPGVQALNHAFVAMANIGNDMSPITRKKAKKILVLTTVIAAVRRKFGN